MIKKILFLSKDHPFISYKLKKEGFICNFNDKKYFNDKKNINEISLYDGIIVKNDKIEKKVLKNMKNIKFIARIGSGTENIDKEYLSKRKISLINSPEGNKDSVAEHAIGMLLSITNNISSSYQEIRKGKWRRKKNKGLEIMGKTIGIIGYGNTGKSFAKKLSNFDVKKIIFYDIIDGIDDKYAKQVNLETIFSQSDIISLHVPYNKKTKGIINYNFINRFNKSFYLINTSRGKCIVTNDLVKALKYGKIRGACLDVLEYENCSFNRIIFNKKKSVYKDFLYLIRSNKVIITPHIAGLTKESKYKMEKIIVNKIIMLNNKLLLKTSY